MTNEQVSEGPDDGSAAAPTIQESLSDGSHETYNLKNFLVRNDKLLPALSLFTALTVFSTTVVEPELAGRLLSFFFLLTTGVLFLELRSHFPIGLRLSWRPSSITSRLFFHTKHFTNRLGLFSILIDCSFGALALVTAWEYRYHVFALLIIVLVVLLIYRFLALAKRIASQIPTIREFLVGLAKRRQLQRALQNALFLLIGIAVAIGIPKLLDRFPDLPEDLLSALDIVGPLTAALLLGQTLLRVLSRTAKAQRLGRQLEMRSREELRMQQIVDSIGLIDEAAAHLDEDSDNYRYMMKDREGLVQEFEELRRRRGSRNQVIHEGSSWPPKKPRF